MKIAMLTIGSRGDVAPLVALAHGLQAAGHTVRLATGAHFRSFVEGHGVEFAALTIPEHLDVRQKMQKVRFNPFGVNEVHASRWDSCMARTLAGALDACRGCDLVVVTGTALWGLDVAEGLGLPGVVATLWPTQPTADFPPIWFPRWFSSLGRRLNRWLHLFYGRRAYRRWAKPIEDFRMDVLGLAANTALRFDLPHREDVHTVLGVSPHILPKPSDWNERFDVTGYWFLDEPAALAPDLERFLRAGSAPVYVGFGSTRLLHPERMLELVVEALARTGQRGLLAAGWGRLAGNSLPDSIFCLSEAPHSALFPHCLAVVHHGGAGTTAAAARAGKPQVLMTVMNEQSRWGELVYRHRLGPRPLDLPRATAATLARAIAQAIGDESIARSAETMGCQIRREDGVGVAVAAIERFSASWERLRAERQMFPEIVWAVGPGNRRQLGWCLSHLRSHYPRCRVLLVGQEPGLAHYYRCQCVSEETLVSELLSGPENYFLHLSAETLVLRRLAEFPTPSARPGCLGMVREDARLLSVESPDLSYPHRLPPRWLAFVQQCFQKG